MLEDTRLGLSLLSSVGKWAGVEMPLVNGFLAIASAITGRDLYGEGRTLENLGISGLSRDEMSQMLREGL